MRNFSLKILIFALLFVGFTACDDDDNPVVIDNVMVVMNRTNGIVSLVNTTDGTLTSLGNFTYQNAPLTGIRDFLYNSSDQMIYAVANGQSDGLVYRINPSTLVATVINDNADYGWDAIAEIEMYNGDILGTAYLDEFTNEFSGHSLVILDTDGTEIEAREFMHDGSSYNPCCGMGLEYGANNNELLIADDDRIMRSNISGIISEVITLTYENFPEGRGGGGPRIKCLEKDANGNLYGLTTDGYFVSIDLDTNVMTYISTFGMASNDYQALSFIPETVFQ